MKVIKWLDDHFEEAILLFLLAVIACVELAQVICRNVPFFPALTWAEELCRFAWIATVFLSLPYTIRKSNILRVSVLIDSLSPRMHNALNIFVDAVTAVMMGILAWNSVAVLQRIIASGETSPAMVWPMWVMYAVVLVGFALATVRSVQMAFIHVVNFNEIPVTYLEEQMEAEVAEEWVKPATIDQKYADVSPAPVTTAAADTEAVAEAEAQAAEAEAQPAESAEDVAGAPDSAEEKGGDE